MSSQHVHPVRLWDLSRGLASLGRGPDSRLVHMSDKEVEGLQQIAKAHGGSLTVNPHTGLYEAGFLSSILPVIAGGLLSLTGIGAIPGAAIVAGGTGLATGDWKKGLMAGLGAYGGYGMGSTLQGMGDQAAANAASPLEYVNPSVSKVGEAADTLQYVNPSVSPVANPSSWDAMKSGLGQLGTKSGSNAFVSGVGKLGIAEAAAPSIYDATNIKQNQLPTHPNEEYYRTTYHPGIPNPNYGPGQLPLTGQSYSPGTYSSSYDYTQGYDGGGFVPASGASQGIKAPTMNQDVMRQYYASLLQPGAPPQTPPPPDANNAYMANLNQSFMPKPSQPAPVAAPPATPPSQSPAAAPGLAGLDWNTWWQRIANDPNSVHFAEGGLGRYVHGPGDGVSDDVPARMNDGQPAALAEGEFVIPARAVSEIGNGSSDAGAKRLYAMLDRIQGARKKTVGKDKVAVRSGADRMLPA